MSSRRFKNPLSRMLSLKQGLPGALFLVLGLCLFFGTAGAAGAFSVDVKNLHYSDDSGRSIMYDYSAGSVGSVPPNAILLNGSAQITPGSGESGNSYFWGQAPGLPAATVTLGAGKATVSPVNAATGGVVVLFSEPPVPAATGPAAWFYALNLSNFNVDMTTPKVYEFDIGLGRDESRGLTTTPPSISSGSRAPITATCIPTPRSSSRRGSRTGIPICGRLPPSSAPASTLPRQP